MMSMCASLAVQSLAAIDAEISNCGRDLSSNALFIRIAKSWKSTILARFSRYIDDDDVGALDQ